LYAIAKDNARMQRRTLIAHGPLALAAMMTAPRLAQSQPRSRVLRLAVTHTVEDSGLARVLVPAFERDSGFEVRVLTQGSMAVHRLAVSGDVDVLISHLPAEEARLVREGHALVRVPFAQSEFVIAGPRHDAAHIAGLDPVQALSRIAQAQHRFVSRGDNSGTHVKEMEIWKAAGITPAGAWYLRAGIGMGAALGMADQRSAYLLSDRPTLLAYQQRLDLQVWVRQSPLLTNPYAVLAVNPNKSPRINAQGAQQFVQWLAGPRGRERIEQFRIAGQAVFALPPLAAQ
jgi:tungstate transport system substrate-binding protein